MNLNMIIEEFLKAYENCSQEPDQWERLALALEERGIPTLSGEQWTPATTSKFFQEHVAGQAEHQSRLKRFVSLFNVSSSELKGEIAWAEMARRLNDAGIGGPNREEWTGDSARDFYERWAKPEMETTYGLEGPLEARSEDAPGPSGDDPSGGKVVPIFASESARKKVEEKRQALPVPVKPVVTVYVEVQGSSESITTEIKGLLKAELQSLGEIEITDKNPKWRIVAMATMRQGSMDVAFMYVVSET
ncbi:MAG: hypothetical protein FJY85_03570, partial [Deltaproteobacteria bacterium]|nr:hypothetical protein [Deltaproteobacteria bacterium]